MSDDKEQPLVSDDAFDFEAVFGDNGVIEKEEKNVESVSPIQAVDVVKDAQKSSTETDENLFGSDAEYEEDFGNIDLHKSGTFTTEEENAISENSENQTASEESEEEQEKTPEELEAAEKENIELKQVSQYWQIVAAVWGGFLATSTLYTFIFPAEKVGFFSTIIFLFLYNIFGGAALVAPLLLWRSSELKDKKWFYNIALTVAIAAMTIAVLVLLTEFYRYDFTIKAL